MHEDTLMENLSHYLVNSFRCHFHIVVTVKEILGEGIRPDGEVSASPSLSAHWSFVVSFFRWPWLRHRTWRQFVTVSMCLWRFLVVGDEGQRTLDRSRMGGSAVVVNNLAHSYSGSTNELLREKLSVNWRAGPWWVYIWISSQLACFAV